MKRYVKLLALGTLLARLLSACNTVSKQADANLEV